MKADLHLHSEFSWDSKVPINKYIEIAEEKGFGAISITDHNNAESHELIKKLQENTDVILIPGQEVNTLDGHLLIYGWVKLIERDLTMHETIIRAKKLAGDNPVVCIAAHPFDKLRGGKGKRVLNTGIDGIEILNGSTLLRYYNNKAEKQVRNSNYIKLANSDAHRIDEFGIAWNELPDLNSINDLLMNLKNAQSMGTRIGIRRKTKRFIRRKLGLMKA